MQTIQLACPSIRKIIKLQLNNQQFNYATCEVLEQQLIKHFQFKGLKISNIHIYYDKRLLQQNDRIKTFQEQKYTADFEIDLHKTENKNKMQVYNKVGVVDSQSDKWNYQPQQPQQQIQQSSVILPLPQQEQNKFLNISSQNINRINQILHNPIQVSQSIVPPKGQKLDQDVQVSQSNKFSTKIQQPEDVTCSQLYNSKYQQQVNQPEKYQQLYNLQQQKLNPQGQLQFSSNLHLTSVRQQLETFQEPQISQFTHRKQEETKENVNTLQTTHHQEQRRQYIEPQVSHAYDTSIIKKNDDVAASNLLVTNQQKSFIESSEERILTSNAISTKVQTGSDNFNVGISQTQKRQTYDRNQDNLSVSQLSTNDKQVYNKTKDIKINVQHAKEQKFEIQNQNHLSKTNQFKQSVIKQGITDSQIGLTIRKNCDNICNMIEKEDSQDSVPVSNKFVKNQKEHQEQEIQYNNILDNKKKNNFDLISVDEEDIQQNENTVKQLSLQQVAKQLNNCDQIEYISDQIRQLNEDIQKLQECIKGQQKRHEIFLQDKETQYANSQFDQLNEIDDFKAQNEKIKSLEKYSQYLQNYIQKQYDQICPLTIKELLQINISFLADTQILGTSKLIQIFINWSIRNSNVFLYNTDQVQQEISEQDIQEYLKNDFYITVNKNTIQDLRRFKLYEFFILILESGLDINKSIIQSHRILTANEEQDRISKQDKAKKQLCFSQMFLKQQQLEYIHQKISLQRLQQMYDKVIFTYDDVSTISYDDLYNCQILTTKVKKLQIVKLLIDYHETVLLNNEIVLDDFNQLQPEQYDQNFFITFDHNQQLQCIYFVDRFKSDLMMLHVLIQ